MTWDPQEGEREVVAEVLGDRAAWLADGARWQDADAALMFWPRRELRKAGLDERCLPSGPRYVKLATAGANHVGWSTWPADLPVAVTPGATGPFIAEYVLGCVLAWARGIPYHTNEIRKGRFHVGAPVRALLELHVGIVGYGGVGQAVGALLARLGCTVSAVNRSGRTDAPGPLAHLGTMGDLPALAAQSDVLVLCVPLTQETLGLVDLDLLSAMSGRQALLVNVARGAVVKEEDLYAWLDSDGTRHWAALDVWWQYPRDEGMPFTMPFDRLPNVMMTPHDSPNVTGFRRAMVRRACEDLLEDKERRARGEGPLHVVDAAAHRLPVEGDGR